MFRKVPHLDHLVFRIGEMHTIMTSLRTLGASIERSCFDEEWIAAGIRLKYNAIDS